MGGDALPGAAVTARWSLPRHASAADLIGIKVARPQTANKWADEHRVDRPRRAERAPLHVLSNGPAFRCRGGPRYLRDLARRIAAVAAAVALSSRAVLRRALSLLRLPYQGGAAARAARRLRAEPD